MIERHREMADKEEVIETEKDADAETPESESEQTQKVADVQDPVEVLAREMGWKNRDEYSDKSGKPFVGAREFILREREFSDRLRDKLASTESGVKEIKEHFDRQLEVERKRMRQELQEAKREAIKEGNVEEVERIDDEMNKIESDSGEDDRYRTKLYVEWQKKNTWFNDDPDLTEIAVGLEKTLMEKGLETEEILEEIDRKMKRFLPKDEKQGKEERKQTVSPVEGDANRSGIAKRHTVRDLTDQQRDALKVFKAQIPGYTAEMYIKDLEEQGVLV
jgi:hypothetical protein